MAHEVSEGVVLQFVNKDQSTQTHKTSEETKNVIDYFVLLDQGASKNRKIIVPQSISAEANNWEGII